MEESPENIAKYYEQDALGGFSSALMKTISLADLSNRKKLESSFPNHVKAWNIWFNGGAENER